MGSCNCCQSNSVDCPSSTVKVIHSNGSIQDLPGRMKAAELLLDNPHHFVCSASGLQIGRRINHLTADEELDLGHLYFLLPMPKLHSVLSATDMASLAVKAISAMKDANKLNSRARIIPSPFGDLIRQLQSEMKQDFFLLEEGEQTSGGQEQELAVPKLNLEDNPEQSTASPQLRLKVIGKPWEPKLETIREFQPTLRDLLQSDIEK